MGQFGTKLLEDITQFLLSIDAVTLLASSWGKKNPRSQKKQEDLNGFFPPCQDPVAI